MLSNKYALLLLLMSSLVNAQPFTDIHEKYSYGLGSVRGAILSFKYLEEVCNDEYPQYKNANEDAYNKWRLKNELLISEIDGYYSKLMTKLSENKEEKYSELIRLTDENDQKAKMSLRKELESQGSIFMDKFCFGYVNFVDSPVNDTGEKYSEVIKYIRDYNAYFLK